MGLVDSEMNGKSVADEELLYRCVRSEYVQNVNGELRAGENGFLDKKKRPSVNRAMLDDYDPARTKREKSDAVAELRTADVRRIDSVHKKNLKGLTEFTYVFDVEADPLPNNAAHAEIYADREMSGGSFERLREELSDLAVIVLGPE